MKEDETKSTVNANVTITKKLSETDEALRQKEQHFKNLGLLTHKAAEKHRQTCIQNATTPTSSQNTKKNEGNTKKSNAPEYTGTLKTVIKLNRNSNGSSTNNSANNAVSNLNSNTRKTLQNSGKEGARRQSLKMTFQKGRGRPANSDRVPDNQSQSEDSYYTIQNEVNFSHK